jgi:hypothetical protein
MTNERERGVQKEESGPPQKATLHKKKAGAGKMTEGRAAEREAREHSRKTILTN